MYISIDNFCVDVSAKTISRIDMIDHSFES